MREFLTLRVVQNVVTFGKAFAKKLFLIIQFINFHFVTNGGVAIIPRSCRLKSNDIIAGNGRERFAWAKNLGSTIVLNMNASVNLNIFSNVVKVGYI